MALTPDTIPSPAMIDRDGIQRLSVEAGRLNRPLLIHESRELVRSSPRPLAFPEEALPPKPCPHCGVEMNRGVRQGDLVLYTTHLKACLVLEARMEAERAAQQVRYRDTARLQRANLPPDVEGIGDLAGYCQRFPATPDTQMGIGLAQAFLQACAAAAKGEGPWPLSGFTLEGAKGAGKSTLAASLARSLFAAGVAVMCDTGPELYGRLLAASREGDLEDELRRYMRAQVLVIDDLGREKPSPWWVDQCLFPLVDARYRSGRPLILTTNYTWAAMEERYENARNEREEAASAAVLVDRLQERCASVPFGPRESHRQPAWDFIQKGAK